MSLEEARWWTEALLGQLNDDTFIDDEKHFKIAALERILKRNEELGSTLAKINEAKDVLMGIIGQAL